MDREQRTTEAQEEASGRLSPMLWRLIVWGVIALIVIAVALIVFAVRRNWTYHRLEVVSANEQEDTLSVTYCNVDGNILRYGSDGASLRDRNERLLWTVSYQMQAPAVTSRGSMLAIYDTGGTSIVICDRNGQIGAVSSDLPIRKADIGSRGTVATIQDDVGSSWIEYYSPDGTQIATIKTSIDEPGFPMDLALSDDGMTLVVSYLVYRDGKQRSLIHFYSFTATGQSQMDNRIAEFEYTDQIIPEVDWFGRNTCVVFREGGFTIYQNSRIPEQRVEVQVDGEIQSVFHSNANIGLIFRDPDVGGLHLRVYNQSGEMEFEKELDGDYSSVELVDGEITLYRGAEMVVYSLTGANRFTGKYEGTVRQILSLGRQRYLVVTESGIRIAKLG